MAAWLLYCVVSMVLYYTVLCVLHLYCVVSRVTTPGQLAATRSSRDTPRPLEVEEEIRTLTDMTLILALATEPPTWPRPPRWSPRAAAAGGPPPAPADPP